MSLITPGFTIRVIMLAAGLMGTFPARGAGQAPPLKQGGTVWVTTHGDILKGRFRSWADSIFEWEGPAGLVRTPLREIERIETSDPIRDGLLRGTVIGAVAGAGYGLLIGIGLSCTRDCGADYSRTRDIVGGTFAFALLGAGQGAVAGVILDAAIHRRRLVYRKSGFSSLTVTPVVGPGRRGVTMIMRW